MITLEASTCHGVVGAILLWVVRPKGEFNGQRGKWPESNSGQDARALL